MARAPKDPFRGRPKPGDDRYDVGYGKPPAATQFKPGRSGNPKGRPKGARNKLPALHDERLREIILGEAYRPIKVNDGPRRITVPMAQAVVRSIAVNAVKGEVRAQRQFVEMLGETEKAKKREHDEILEAVSEYKAYWEYELERRRVLGISGPDPLPHPDHLVIDPLTGTVSIRGPMTREEKVKWDRLRERKREYEEQLAELEIVRDDPKNCEIKSAIDDDIEHSKRVLKLLKRIE